MIDRLTEVADAASEVAEVALVVVDDDVDRSAESVAHEAASRFAGGLHYHSSASGNISVARNAALDLGIETGDWLALTDDDCMPDAEWLRELFVVQRRYDAECVTGTCIESTAPGAPPWLQEEPFLEPPSTAPDGAEVEIGHIKNAMFSAEALRRHGLRFDPAFGGTGGEDAMFFYDAHAQGIQHRHAAGAIVVEEVPLERSTLPYQLRRRFWYGNTEAITSLAHRRTSRHRMAASGIKLSIGGSVRPVAHLLRRRPVQFRYSASVVLQGLGRILGAAGIKVAHR